MFGGMVYGHFAYVNAVCCDAAKKGLTQQAFPSSVICMMAVEIMKHARLFEELLEYRSGMDVNHQHSRNGVCRIEVLRRSPH